MQGKSYFALSYKYWILHVFSHKTIVFSQKYCIPPTNVVLVWECCFWQLFGVFLQKFCFPQKYGIPQQNVNRSQKYCSPEKLCVFSQESVALPHILS